MKYLVFYFLSGAVLFISSLSCNCNKDPSIVHMDYFDIMDTVYNIYDSTHLKPFLDKSLYFLVEEKNVGCLDDSFYIKKIYSDPFCREQIENKYSSLSIVWYKKSENTDQLVKQKRSKYLSYCNDDIIVEFIWKFGVLEEKFHYQEGRIIGSKNIFVK
jgi:hypothetical protein